MTLQFNNYALEHPTVAWCFLQLNSLFHKICKSLLALTSLNRNIFRIFKNHSLPFDTSASISVKRCCTVKMSAPIYFIFSNVEKMDSEYTTVRRCFENKIMKSVYFVCWCEKIRKRKTLLRNEKNKSGIKNIVDKDWHCI